MLDMYFTVRSVTPAQKGRDALNRAGVRCRMLRAPRAIAQNGCAYALAVRAVDGQDAALLLDRAGVETEGAWQRLQDGSFMRAWV